MNGREFCHLLLDAEAIAELTGLSQVRSDLSLLKVNRAVSMNWLLGFVTSLD
jgi:hypothetical protein